MARVGSVAKTEIRHYSREITVKRVEIETLGSPAVEAVKAREPKLNGGALYVGMRYRSSQLTKNRKALIKHNFFFVLRQMIARRRDARVHCCRYTPQLQSRNIRVIQSRVLNGAHLLRLEFGDPKIRYIEMYCCIQSGRATKLHSICRRRD